MKTIQSILMKPGIIFGCIIALILMLSHGAPGYAARVAGSDENVNTTTTPADSARKMIKAAPVIPVKKDVPAAREAIAPVQEKEAAAPALETKETKPPCPPMKLKQKKP